MAVCKIAASKLLAKVFQVRRKQVGNLLAACRSVENMVIVSEVNFGEGLHCTPHEPIFYDTAYCLWPKDQPLPINEDGECVVAEEVVVMKPHKETLIHKYKCSARCKLLTKCEVDSILSFKQAFDNPIDEVIRVLYDCDTGCPNMHHNHIFGPEGFHNEVAKLGHPLPCFNGTGCKSKLRILRCGSVHHPVLFQFLKNVYSVLNALSKVKVIDTALGTVDCTKLLYLTETKEYGDLLSNEIETSYEQRQSATGIIVSKLRQPNSESQLMIEHAGSIDRLEKLTEDFAEHICVSCERLCQRKNLSHIGLSEDEIDS